jgi:hypothetical protein
MQVFVSDPTLPRRFTSITNALELTFGLLNRDMQPELARGHATLGVWADPEGSGGRFGRPQRLSRAAFLAPAALSEAPGAA